VIPQDPELPIQIVDRFVDFTYHVRLGLSMVLALERARGGIRARSPKVGRKCLAGHYERCGGRKWCKEKKITDWGKSG